MRQSELEEATAFYRRSLEASRKIGDQFGVALSLHGLGEVAARGSDPAEADARLREALDIRRELGDRRGIAESLEAFASLAADAGDGARASRLLGAARSLRERLRAPAPADRRRELDRLEARLGDRLGASRLAGEIDRGRTMFLEEAVALALGGAAA